MDTIFVKSVKFDGAAYAAGLRIGEVEICLSVCLSVKTFLFFWQSSFFLLINTLMNEAGKHVDINNFWRSELLRVIDV